jgi:ABC-type multidrug transport system fused ATPase/permease subunit
MIWNYIYKNFFLVNKKTILIYIIVNLIIYPTEVLGLSRLYSKLINKSKDVNIKKINKIFKPDILTTIKKEKIEGIILLITVILLLLSLVDRVRNYIYAIINAKFKSWIRIEMFKQNLNNFNTNFRDVKVGKEVLKMEDIIVMIKEFIHSCITNILSIIIIVIIVGIYLFYLNFNIGIIFCIQIVIYSIILYIFYTKIIKILKYRIENFYKIGDNIDNSYVNLANILSNNKNQEEILKNSKISNEYKELCIKSDILIGNTILLLRICVIVTFIIIISYSYKLMLKNKLDKLNFTTVIIILIYFLGIILNNNLRFIISLDYVGQINYHKNYLESIFNEDKEILKIDNKNIKGKIEFRNLTYKYPKSKKLVLNNLNVTIEPKQKIAILGKSGSGKSTLMKLLIKFNKPLKGEILLDNTNIQNIDTSYLRDNITYINQNTILFDEDIYYNIKYGSKQSNNLKPIAPAPSPNLQPLTNLTPSISNKVYPKEEILEDSKIEEILKKYNLLTIYDKLENKLRTKAGPRGTNLSLGMQKVTITLRGILKKSKVIIFDEPLAGLDQLTREKIIKLIMNETKNKTVIIITHDKEILPYMDKTINLQEINNN